jgi:serine/threonine protein phosphatase 1
VERDERVYAVGDIHGRADLLERLLETIHIDNQSRRPLKSKIVILGDFVDRGPDSAFLTRRLIHYTKASNRFIVLKGNHEDVMQAALEGRLDALEAWLQVGGVETLVSWGIPRQRAEAGASESLLRMARQKIPVETRQWLKKLPLSHRSGDVFFVHAGVRPGVKLTKQKPGDLLWIRDDFIHSEDRHPVLVVHGHHVNEAGPEILHNRVGIDTGAYRTGRLTAVGLEDHELWTLTT